MPLDFRGANGAVESIRLLFYGSQLARDSFIFAVQFDRNLRRWLYFHGVAHVLGNGHWSFAGDRGCHGAPRVLLLPIAGILLSVGRKCRGPPEGGPPGRLVPNL